MKQTLQLKLSQHLTLTPQLQQSIRLLQLSTIELNQEVERILQENPLLEKEENEGEEEPAADQTFSNSVRPEVEAESRAVVGDEEPAGERPTDAPDAVGVADVADYGDYGGGDGDWGGGGGSNSEDEEFFPQQVATSTL